MTVYSRTSDLPIREERTSRCCNGGDGDVHKSYKKNESSRRLSISKTILDRILDWVVFPLVLFVQFGSTMIMQQRHGVLQVQWTTTMAAITTFCLTSIAHRKIFRAHPVESYLLILLPEIFTNAVLLTILAKNELVTALNLLIVSTAILMITTLIGKFQIDAYDRSVPLTKANDCKRLLEDDDEVSVDEDVC